MAVQPLDFSFIATAGQQIGQGVIDTEKMKDIKIDDNQAKKAHEEIVKQVSQEYVEATGEKDPVKIASFTAKYLPPKFKSETAAQAALRWVSVAPQMKTALEELKSKRYFKETAGTPATPEQPGQTVTIGGQAPTTSFNKDATPEQAWRAKHPGQAQNAQAAVDVATSQERIVNQRGLAGQTPMPSVGARPAPVQQAPGMATTTDTINRGTMPGDATTAQAPAIPAQPEKALTYEEKLKRAQELGITIDKQVAADLQRTQDTDVGKNYGGPGQTRAPLLAGMAGAGVDVTTGAAKELAAATPTDKDILTNDRLKKQEEQRNKLRAALAAMSERRLRAHDLSKDNLKLLDTQIRAVTAQINASENRSKMALGLNQGKDILGEQQYYTGPQWEAEYNDAESTYQSAAALLEKINALNQTLNPNPNGEPNSATDVITDAKDLEAWAWIQNATNKSKPQYEGVKEKLKAKYPTIVR